MHFSGLWQCISQREAHQCCPGNIRIRLIIPSLQNCAERSCIPFAARPCGTAGKAAGGLPALAAVPGKAGLSRLVSSPVIWAPLTAELMEPPKLRELASTSLLSFSREDLGFELTPGSSNGRGGGRGMEQEPRLLTQTAFQEGCLGMGKGWSCAKQIGEAGELLGQGACCVVHACCRPFG